MNKRIGTVPILLIIFLGYSVGYGQRMTNQSVITEIYVPKVIINAKWGTNAGEFGGQKAVYTEPIPNYYRPESLVVDSKGNIYILDLVNNRIQKFDNDGKYILSIPVKSFIGYQVKYIPQEIRMAEMPDEYDEKKEHQLLKTKGVPDIDGYTGRIVISPSKYFGINISMDSDDNLYYYCRKDLSITNEAGEWVPNPNDKGEIWKFVRDKLVRKWQTNVMARYEPSKDYEVEKKKINKINQARCKIEKKVTNKNIYIITCPDGDKIEIESNTELSDKGKLLQNNEIEIFDKKNKRFKTYNKNGKLKNVRGIIPFGGVSDENNNFYKIEYNNSSIKVEKWYLKIKNE